MTSDKTADPRAETQPEVAADDTVQLTVNIGFYRRPFFIDPDDCSHKAPAKEGPPFIRFPVQLGAKDARIVQQLLDSDIAFVAFEIQERDGQAGYYRTVTVRN